MIGMLVAAAVALLLSLFGTRTLITVLTRNRIGQPIREDGPQGHVTKAGTPTMGGIAVVGGAVGGYGAANLYSGVFTRTGLLVMLAITAAGLVGLADDWIKIVHARNLGLEKSTKMLAVLGVGLAFALLMVFHTGVHTELSFTRVSEASVDLGRVLWVVWAIFLIAGFSNAVNLTDGLDGLASGAALVAFSAFMVIAYWQFRHESVYGIFHALDLAMVAAAMFGACAGFLWWNAAPAQIFMGDTGSLAIGTALATLALATSTHLLLLIIGGLFVIETASVILQVTRFRLTGKRIFRMAPFHHHLELGGWPETTVIVRLWLVSGLCTGVGLGIFYADAIAAGITR